MNNMDIWDKAKQPPKSALKEIAAGRLKGKTDINPQWRYQIMTELFGICGVGWKYEIKKLWLENGSEGQTLSFAEIELYIKTDGAWSEPIPGIGGSMMLEKQKNYIHNSDECYKMAVTDALSVAMKMIGVAADIYAGKWDGSKYMAEKKEPQKTSPKNLTPEQSKNVADWKATIDEIIDIEICRDWWKENRDSVMDVCGHKGASLVYTHWEEKGKSLKK